MAVKTHTHTRTPAVVRFHSVTYILQEKLLLPCWPTHHQDAVTLSFNGVVQCSCQPLVTSCVFCLSGPVCLISFCLYKPLHPRRC